MSINFHIVTLFPKAFKSYLGESIIKRALQDGKIQVYFYNPRDYTQDKHKRIDRAPYGGGPGMVIQAEPVILAVEDAYYSVKSDTKKACNSNLLKNNPKPNKEETIVLWANPRGKQFSNKLAKDFAAKYKNIIVVCGRYEGIDNRAKKAIKRSLKLKVADISIGPFILTGGEIPAMVFIDAISRQISGVLGDFNSLEENRITSGEVYTRPEVFEYKKIKYRVPKILLTGHHAKIEEWKMKRSNKSI
jgi:tRNA (guanine37-N1)-methyltransferase